MTISTIPSNAIFKYHNYVMTDSLKVAEAFSKQHKHVLEKIQSLECSEEFASANFSADVQMIGIGNGATRESKYYRMTKDGFMFLVMGFTGKKAAQMKEAYISAFNMMAEELHQIAPERLSTIMSQTIGTDGFHMLGSLIKGKVTSLPVPQRRSTIAKLWSQIHTAFGVRSAADIPADQLDSARNFIAAYAIEGEWLGKDKGEETFTLTREQAMKLTHLLHSVDWVNHRWHQGIGKGVESLNRPLFSAIFEHVNNMARAGRYLDRELVTIRDHFKHLGGMRPDQRLQDFVG